MLFTLEAQTVLKLAFMGSLPTEEVARDVRMVLAEIRRLIPGSEGEDRRKRFLAVALHHRPDLERWFSIFGSMPTPTQQLCQLRSEDAKALRHTIALYLKEALACDKVVVDHDASGPTFQLTVRVYRAIVEPNPDHREGVAKLSTSILMARGFRVGSVAVTLYYTMPEVVVTTRYDDLVH